VVIIVVPGNGKNIFKICTYLYLGQKLADFLQKADNLPMYLVKIANPGNVKAKFNYEWPYCESRFE
jgi:hypothetical protein